MVKGLNTFREYFRNDTDNSIIHYRNSLIAKTQGKIFRYMNHYLYPMDQFVQEYMNSPLCLVSMDALYSYEQLCSVEDLLPDILKQCHVRPLPLAEHTTDDRAYWLGYSYRIASRKYNIPSNELIKRIPYKIGLQIVIDMEQDGSSDDIAYEINKKYHVH